MPQWMQPLTNLNSVKHFAVPARNVMLKGVGLEVLYPNFLALVTFTIILVGVSAWGFRKQLIKPRITRTNADKIIREGPRKSVANYLKK